MVVSRNRVALAVVEAAGEAALVAGAVADSDAGAADEGEVVQLVAGAAVDLDHLEGAVVVEGRHGEIVSPGGLMAI